MCGEKKQHYGVQNAENSDANQEPLLCKQDLKTN